MKPKKVNILGITYSIEYVEKMANVDSYEEQLLWGQICHRDRSIRIHEKGRSSEDVFQILIHEILHGIGAVASLPILADEENHNQLNSLAAILSDLLIRNGWIKEEKNE